MIPGWDSLEANSEFGGQGIHQGLVPCKEEAGAYTLAKEEHYPRKARGISSPAGRSGQCGPRYADRPGPLRVTTSWVALGRTR